MPHGQGFSAQGIAPNFGEQTPPPALLEVANHLHKGPTQTEFSKVADDVEATVYQGSGLAVGAHEFKVVGRNKAGEGKASEVAVVQVN